MDNQEKAYWISEVAELTGMNINTIRKYCLLLETNGYHIARGDQDKRYFKMRDIIAIQEVTRIKKAEKLTLEQACKVVAESYNQPDSTSTTSIMHSITHNEHNAEQNLVVQGFQTQLDTITKRLDDMIQFNQTLAQELEKRDKEHFKRIDELMNAQLETRRMIAATQEQPKKKPFWLFWK